MMVLGYIDDGKIITRKSPISTPTNQLLEMCEIMVGHIDTQSRNPKIGFYINSDTLHLLCRI